MSYRQQYNVNYLLWAHTSNAIARVLRTIVECTSICAASLSHTQYMCRFYEIEFFASSVHIWPMTFRDIARWVYVCVCCYCCCCEAAVKMCRWRIHTKMAATARNMIEADAAHFLLPNSTHSYMNLMNACYYVRRHRVGFFFCPGHILPIFNPFPYISDWLGWANK